MWHDDSGGSANAAQLVIPIVTIRVPFVFTSAIGGITAFGNEYLGTKQTKLFISVLYVFFLFCVVRADPRGKLGRRVDSRARAEGMHRDRQRPPPGTAAAAQLALALELVRLLQPRQRKVRYIGLFGCWCYC